MNPDQPKLTSLGARLLGGLDKKARDIVDAAKKAQDAQSGADNSRTLGAPANGDTVRPVGINVEVGEKVEALKQVREGVLKTLLLWRKRSLESKRGQLVRDANTIFDDAWGKVVGQEVGQQHVVILEEAAKHLREVGEEWKRLAQKASSGKGVAAVNTNVAGTHAQQRRGKGLQGGQEPDSFNKDDVARNDLINKGTPDDDQAKYLARMAAGKSKQGSMVEPLVTGGIEKSEEEKVVAFVESIPDAAIIKFTSPGRKEFYFHRDGKGLFVGKAGNNVEGTDKAWGHSKKGWKWEIVDEKVQEPAGVAAEPAPEPTAKKPATSPSFEEPSWVDLAEGKFAGATAAVAPGVTPEVAAPESFEIRDGGRYRAAKNGVLRTISKKVKKDGKEEYRETFDTGEITVYKTLRALKKVAEEEGWQLESAAPEASASRGPEVSPAGASPRGVSENEAVNKFKDLEDALEVARKNYAKADFEQTSILRKISAVLRFDKTKYQDNGAKEAYDKAFQELLKARLADIHRRRDAGELNEEDYKREMAETLKSFECEGRIKVFQARQQVKMESLATSPVGRFIEFFPKMAHAYNKMPKPARYAIGIALGIGAFLTAPVSGAVMTSGAAAAATLIACTRGTLGGMSTFVLADTVLEQYSDKRAAAAVEKSGSTIFTEYERQSAADRERFFKEKLEKLHGHFEDRVEGMKRRKMAAVIAGVAFGTAIGTGWLGEKIKGLFGSWGGVPPIEAHSGDSTWKLLGQYLSAKDSHFAGMNPAQQTYAIDALKDKLAEMSPAQLKAAGFASGDITQLRIGEHIDFGKLLAGSDVTGAMKGASELSTAAVESITKNNATILEWAQAHPDVKLTDPLIDKILQGNGTGVGSGGSPTVIDVQMQGDSSLGTGLQAKVPEDFVKMPENFSDQPPVPPVIHEVTSDIGPVFTAELQPRVDDWYGQIFRSENAALGQDWVFDREKITNMGLFDIVRDAKLLKEGSFTGYTTGLNREQVENFIEFSQSVAKNVPGFDRAAFLRENPGATVMDYLKKVAPFVERGKMIGLYSTTH